jgi:hypothetical protein
MQVPHSTKHLLDELCAFHFRVVVIGLLVETIKELSTETELLNKVDFSVALVHCFKTNNVGVVQLAHDTDLFAKLLKAFYGVDQCKVEALDSVLETSCLVSGETNHTRDSRSKDRPSEHTIIHFLDGFAERNLRREDSVCEYSVKNVSKRETTSSPSHLDVNHVVA